MSKQVVILHPPVLTRHYPQVHKFDLKLPFDKKVDLPKKEGTSVTKKTDNEEVKKDISSSTEDSKGSMTLEGLDSLENLISSELAEGSGMVLTD